MSESLTDEQIIEGLEGVLITLANHDCRASAEFIGSVIHSLHSRKQPKDAAPKDDALDANDVQWLRDLAENADEIDSEWPNQMLWPETADNLKRFADLIERGIKQANRSVPEAPDDALVGLALRGWKMKMGYSDIERMREALTDVFFYLRGGE